MRLAAIARCALGRVRQAYREIITWLNSIGALLALYALANPSSVQQFISAVPEPYRQIAAIALPIGWFWLVQKGKEIDKKRNAGTGL